MAIFSTLFFFTLVLAALTAAIRDDHIRSKLVIGGSVIIMALDIILCIWAYSKEAGEAVLSFMPPSHTTEMWSFIMAMGEVFLFFLISHLSIRHGKLHCIILAAVGTFPVLWMEFTGRGAESRAAFKFDDLTLLMMLTVGLVGGLICIYAVGYLKDYHLHHKDVKNRSSFFQSLLFLFLAAMFGLVMSDSLTWMFFFWEVTSTISFLLIGYTRSGEAVNNAFRALWMNLLGGCGFMAAILYANMALKINSISDLVDLNGTEAAYVIPVVLLAFAALTKSAQMPFSRWLLGAMVAPTPSSALLHSATMVKAGVYLLIRLSPLMDGNLAGVMITSIGGFTFFAASLLAISQSDGKKVLAYSTISNLGLITACAGVGEPVATWAAIMLLLFHAVSKSLMFLTVGAVENATGSRDIEDMHGMIVKMPRMAYLMTVGICGMFLAPFGMLVAKWAALKAYIDSNNVALVIFLVFGSATTMFYWGKWLGKLFAMLHQSETLRDVVHKNEWNVMYALTGLVIALCVLFPMIGTVFVQPMLAASYGIRVGDIISENDIRVMLMMLFMIGLMPGLARVLIKYNKEKVTMSYMAGVNAGDDRHFIDSMGGVRPSYLSNWYMEDLFGEKRILSPSLYLSAVAMTVFMVIAVGGAL
ncbi:MAG: NADH-quinone oxidoreductase subunit L [Lachnospiraceae bacterium]|nr:NADH-quinone oxidoreductase subunit L [Lachnospiraceae bacterium]